MKFKQILSAPRPAAFCNFHFGLLGLHFLLFCFVAFPYWIFISFHFELLDFHFFSFWPFGPSFPSIFACLGCHVGSPPQVAKNGPFPNEI